MISYNTPIIFQNTLTLSEKAWRRWASLLTPQPKPMGPSGDPVTRHHRRAADLERSDLCAVGHMSLHALDTWRGHNDVMAIAKKCEHVLTPLFVIHEWIPSKTQNVCIQNPCEHNVCCIQMYSITPVTLWLKWAQHTNQSSPLCFGFSDFWIYLSANLFPSTLT